MPDFLTRAACRGRRPRHLVTHRHISRPHLVAKLLRERHVARFIVAPDGFGKSALSFEYADTVFSFDHVFWINGKSPCFLRDLDARRIAKTLLAEDSQPFLVVFEDVPPLDPERVELLSREMDRLLDRECEVLVTCVPTCDAFDCHRDRVKLGSEELLLTDEEVDVLRTSRERSETPASTISPACRVAGMLWGPPDAGESFLASALNEELPADLLLCFFVILSLQRGSLDDITAFGPCDTAQAALLAERYPYLGIDCQAERFDAAPFSDKDIATAFSSCLDRAAERSLFPDRDVLVARVADALVARHRFDRACGLVRLLASRSQRAHWLALHDCELIGEACLIPAHEVYRSLSGESGDDFAALAVAEAVRRALLGDRRAACSAARRVAQDAAASLKTRTTAALVLAKCADKSERQRAGALVAALGTAAAEEKRVQEMMPACEAQEDLGWVAAASVHTALAQSYAEGAEAWVDWYDRGVRGCALGLSSAWVLDRAGRQADYIVDPNGASPRIRSEALDRLASIVRIKVNGDRGHIGLAQALAGAAYEKACEQGVVVQPGLDAATTLAVRRFEATVFAQRSTYEHIERDRADQRRSFVATHPDTFRSAPPAQESMPVTTHPILTVNLFGGFEVRIGQTRIDPARFRRQKVKTLLALLVLNRGKEYSRDKLVSLLWPESNLEAARKNFYGIWSMLRRALSTSAGTCPYLIRQQNGLRLDASLLVSDVDQFDEVCRTLLFERPGYGGWAYLYDQVSNKFSDDLVPSENDNDAIVSLRLDYRNRLVDALVAASTRLIAAGDVQEGLWFARAALQRDRTREDAYTALMRAQVSASQRTAALETYFACRRFLTDELGIDPSLETMALYHEIIETEEILE